MLVDVADACRAIAGLRAGNDPSLRRMLSGGRLVCASDDGAPDYVDDMTARLAVAALRHESRAQFLIVHPDDRPRRTAIAFVAALVTCGIARVRMKARFGVVLHATADPRIRKQLLSARLGGLSLSTIFAQHFQKADAATVETVSTPGGLHLPRVFIACSPADPHALLRNEKPLWVAVDCADASRLDWIRDLLSAANLANVPVIGWTSSPFSPACDVWRETGGSVFVWPRIKWRAEGPKNAVELQQRLVSVDVIPTVLVGKSAVAISQSLARATEALISARNKATGRLGQDALSVAWRLLRSLENLPVRPADYEADAPLHWGVPRLASLHSTLAHFIAAVEGGRSGPAAELEEASHALLAAESVMRDEAAPLWDAAANLCVDAKVAQTVVFLSRARREMFQQSLLARYNVSADDLAALGTRLVHLSELRRRSEHVEERFVLVGFPWGERRQLLARCLEGQELHVLLWPHQQRLAEAQLRAISNRARMSCDVVPFLSLRGIPSSHGSAPLRIQRERRIDPHASTRELGLLPDQTVLWKRPDLADAVSSLFQNSDPEPSDEVSVVSGLEYGDGEAVETTHDIDAEPSLWLDSVVEISFVGETAMLRVGSDEPVNVVDVSSGVPRLEQRYARGLRAGDDVLLIRGHQRQTLYELLISRVHAIPLVAQYILLVERWQTDFSRAYFRQASQGQMSEERLLQQLRAQGSQITSTQTVRTWIRRSVLAPNDADDLLRVARILSLRFVEQYYKQIHAAGRRLKGLHINLSARLNRWLASGGAALATESSTDDVVDDELGLTVHDFKHSLLRLKVRAVRTVPGRYYRGNLGLLESPA